jgi:hypothetical protein
VGVVAHQRPGIAGRLALQKQIRQALQKILPIAVIPKNIASVDAPEDQMVQGAGRIYARLPWHDPPLTAWRQYVNNETTSRFSALAENLKKGFFKKGFLEEDGAGKAIFLNHPKQSIHRSPRATRTK